VTCTQLLRTVVHVYERLGFVLRAAREKSGLEQAQVAAALGVGQQAVSTWERGRSRPRRSMIHAVARVLKVDEATLLDVGYSGTESASPLPPRAATLPFAELPPDRFEDITTEIAQLRHPEGHASRFGGQGEKQFGIDILVTGADGQNIATGQCKRHKQFGKEDVSAAVAAVAIDASKHYLFLSKTNASSGSRNEISAHAGWELWDGQDLSRYIRSLPLDQAVRIVDTYFPGHREAFLGVPLPGPWLLPEDYFLHAKDELLRQDWNLVGRADQLTEVTAATSGQECGLAVVIGRGGIGKTRFLREIAESLSVGGAQVRVLPRGEVVDAASFELLPAQQPLVVLIDDAHERDDIGSILSRIWRRNTAAGVVLATRPYRWSTMRSELERIPFRPPSLVKTELDDLSLSEAEALAREALGGQGTEVVVRRLAQLTRDCPLVTVAGGVLISRGQLDLVQLDKGESVRDAILRGFRDALAADAGVDQDTRAGVLDVVAALQPFRAGDEAFRTAMSKLVGKPYDVLSKHLRSLEQAGIFQRRGNTHRIVPDLLGDVVLAQACFDEDTEHDTGYIDRVRSAVAGEPLRHLFVNVNRVDWKIRQENRAGSSVVDALWGPLQTELADVGVEGRLKLVRLLARVAYFQPTRVVSIARWLIDNPSDRLDDEEAAKWEYLGTPTHQDVLYKLPDMLKAAAYSVEALPDVLNLLWELAQHDSRPTNQFYDHPMRVLNDLAKFELGKPLAYNIAVLESASKWFADDQSVTPFDVLKPLLATEETHQTIREHTLRFQPFLLNVEAVGPIRQRVIALALDEIRSADIRRAIAGVNALSAAWRYPTGMHGRQVTDDERDRWTPQFIDTIASVGAVASKNDLDPVVLVAIRQELHRYAMYSGRATRAAAEAVLQTLRNDLPDRVALTIHDSWGHLIRTRNDDYTAVQAKLNARLDAVVAELDTMPETAVIALIAERMAGEAVAFQSGTASPARLIAALIKARPSLASSLIAIILAGDAPALEPILAAVLAAYADIDSDDVVGRARNLLAEKDAAITRAVADSIGWNRGHRKFVPGEHELLLDLAAHPDVLVRQAPVAAARQLTETDPVAACKLLAAVEFVDDTRLAEEVFMCFDEPFSLSWEMLTPRQASAMRRRLVKLADVGENYAVVAFFARRSAVDPDWVVELLQDRVTFAEGLEALNNYRPMPHMWNEPLRVRESEEFVLHLRRLYAWIAEGVSSPIRQEAGATIFEEVARPFDETVVAILADALCSADVVDICTIAAILRKAPRTFIWDYPQFVQEALQCAADLGEDCRERMENALWTATISGVRTGTPGRPFREDIEQRDRSQEVAATMPQRSPAERFYRNMVMSAEQHIAQDLERDRVDDGRDW
jgi:transcriptional regulator with XRE-family HTH domain